MDLEAVGKLTKDLRAAAATLGQDEARYLVDSYYQMQKDRIRAAHQARTLAAEAEPHDVIAWIGAQSDTLETEIRKALDVYTSAQRAGRWLKSQIGIGPVISAGLLAHIDITKAPTCGHIWRYAGLDPTTKWEKGQKRPWNASLKRLCWILGGNFKKTSGHEDSIYGKLYRERKELEVSRNEAGMFADQAKASLAEKKWRDDTVTRKAYESGKLPAGRLDLRAMRYAVKLCLSHLHHVMYEIHYGQAPPKPYIFSRPEHTHYLAPPLWPCE